MAKEEKKPLCFVISPIGKPGSDVRKHADLVLNYIIRPPAEKAGYEVKRADGDAEPNDITSRVITDVLDADVTIADLTGHNPNVFYEMALRHMIAKPLIPMAMLGTVLPFDVYSQRTIEYDVTDYDSHNQARERLAAAFEAIGAEGFAVSNPVTLAKGVQQIAASADSKDKVIIELQEEIRRLDMMQHATRNELARLIAHERNYRRSQNESETKSMREWSNLMEHLESQSGGDILSLFKTFPTKAVLIDDESKE
ncbi:MAG: hypothetical protein KDJ77_13345 [Rhodobiaceae bacterium]|nr:hypothetical protein [Rhodobiaceae bacterium]